MKFRKKPVVIEAFQWQPDNADSVTAMKLFLGNDYFNHGGLLRIPTLEGVMEAHADAWIVKGVKGEFYPVKPDIFAATYEPVAPQEPAP